MPPIEMFFTDPPEMPRLILLDSDSDTEPDNEETEDEEDQVDEEADLNVALGAAGLDEHLEDPEDESEEDKRSEFGEVLFDPPLYIQRYRLVMDALEDAEKEIGVLKTFVDLGCSECKFIKYFKNKAGTEKVYGVDLDRDILEQNSRFLRPLVADYLEGSRDSPLDIELLHGSIADQDLRLHRVDAVSAIELIEHLNPPELDRFPQTVFGFIQPKIAVITTPNSEYNRLFTNFNGPFRHWDHKFEWTRAEFESWCQAVVLDYPEYEVSFAGVGFPNNSPTPEGPCSQAAVFTRKSDCAYLTVDLGVGEVYESVVRHAYPFTLDTRPLQEKLWEELRYGSRMIASDLKRNTEDYIDSKVVPVQISSLLLFSSINKLTTDVDVITEVLKGNGMHIQDGKVLIEMVSEEDYDEEEEEDHCEIFGTHEYDEEEGSIFDCPCFTSGGGFGNQDAERSEGDFNADLKPRGVHISIVDESWD